MFAVISGADELLEDLPPEDDHHTLARTIKMAGLRGAELTRQLMVYAGKDRLNLEVVNLGALAEETARLILSAKKTFAEAAFEVDRRGAWVQGDATQLRQVVMNLVANAADALGDAPGTLLVGVRTEELGPSFFKEAHVGATLAPGHYVVLSVGDTGCGIAPDVLLRMFDPFFSTKKEGRGLGLAVVLGIVRAHGGALVVTTAPARGTTFQVALPAWSDDGVTRPPSSEAARSPKVRGSGVILLADDEPSIRSILGRALEKSGFSVLYAATGVDAVTLTEAHRPDAVVLDVVMPKMGGPAAAAIIRQKHPQTPIFLMTGHSDVIDLRNLAPSEVTRILRKPFQPRDLVALLADATAKEGG